MYTFVLSLFSLVSVVTVEHFDAAQSLLRGERQLFYFFDFLIFTVFSVKM